MRHLLALVVFVTACGPAQPGVILTFEALSEQRFAGDTVTLRWASEHAKTCSLSPGPGEVAPTGTFDVAPSEATTYTLTCNGTSRTVEVSRTLGIDSFTATPDAVFADEPVTLQWQTHGALSCSLNKGLGTVPLSGSQRVLPETTATYTLSCTGEAQRHTSRDVLVTVTQPTSLDVPTDFAATAQDGMVTFTWAQTHGSANLSFSSGQVFRKVVSPFTVSGLINGVPISARVSAVSGSLESALTDAVTVTPIDGPPLDDSFFGLQWHLPFIGATEVWDAGVRGEGVVVAVVDVGIDLTHEDLLQNVATGQSKDYLGNAPAAFADHGTAVAGLIAARDLNGKGVRGVAPRANVRSFNLLADYTSSNAADAMLRGRDVVAVHNNSWGTDDQNSALLFPIDAQLFNALELGTQSGRGGKGVVYFFAAGNGADPNEGQVDDSNFSGESNNRFVIAVGGVGHDDQRPSYAEAGANVLIAGPTEGNDGRAIVTTDLPGNDGYNATGMAAELDDRAYTNGFNGTSASTPIVAGVGALLLQVRPELSWRDVRRVLAMSARKCDPASAGWATNAAGLHVNHAFGFGAVDAPAAVALARTIDLAGPEKTFEVTAAPALAIPDGSGSVSDTRTISGSGVGHLEFIEVELDIDHPRSGELEITLTRPGSVVDVLHPTHGCFGNVCSNIDHFVFGDVRHLDEPADAAWTLTVRDTAAGNAGTLRGWKLRFYGRD